MHPRDNDKDFFRKITQEINYSNVEFNNCKLKRNFYSLVQRSSIVFGFISTGLMESVLLNKSVIVLPLSGVSNPFFKDFFLLKNVSEISNVLSMNDDELKMILSKERELCIKEVNFGSNASKKLLKRVKILLSK
jgi:hypothetical protein